MNTTDRVGGKTMTQNTNKTSSTRHLTSSSNKTSVAAGGNGNINTLAAGPAAIYLMSYFRSDIAQTGQKDQDLHLSYSRDGLRWYELNNNLPVVKFPNPVRDPFVSKGQDGIWRLMFTGSTTNEAGTKGVYSMLGYAESSDLITWTNYRLLDVMKSYKDQGIDVFNSWAPEWSYDPVHEEYVTYWSSTLNSNTANDNKHYFATTKDWVTFSDAKPFFDPGQKTIDATLYSIDAIERIDGQSVRDKLGVHTDQEIPGNSIWFMFYKDETPEGLGGMRNRQTWSSEGITGTSSYQNPAHISEYVTPLKTEGASVFKVGDKWHMIYDYWWAGKFGLVKTPDITDPTAWSEENMDLRIPYRARHSGMSIMNNMDLWNLIRHYSLEADYPLNRNAKDKSGHKRDGEIIGHPSFTSPGDNDAGYAEFGGEEDAIKFTHLDHTFYIRTISLWVKANETRNSQMLYHEGNADGGIALKIEGDKLVAGVSKSGTSKTISTTFADTDWHQVIIVYEEGILKLYVDGIKQDELNTDFQPKQSSLNQNGEDPKSRNPELYAIERGSRTALLGTGSEHDVFSENSAHSYFEGAVGQVSMYTLPLFDQDIAELYEYSKNQQ